MGKPYTYQYRDNGYSRRHRTYEMPDGSEITTLITRYTYQYFYKPATGPKGGKARKQCARSIYYKAGVFYRACNVKREDGTYYNSLKPYEGWLWDCHAKTSRRQGVPVVMIETVEGVPVTVKDESDDVIWQFGDDLAALENMLGIPEQDRATAPEPATTTETETATANTTENDDARTEWIAATTTEGMQLDLIQYFGYGDATWQELAKPAA